MKINIKNIRLKSICATLFISLFLSCNNGIEELEKRNSFLSSLANLGNDFLDIFTSFGGTLGGILGFNETTPKSDVGKYFKKVQDAVQGTKDKLEKIVANMERDNKPNADAVKKEVEKFINNTLSKIIEGARTASEAIGITGDDLIANIAQNASGVASTGVENLIKGIKSIVDIVLKDGGNAEAGDDKKADDLGSRTANAGDGEAGKLFGNTAIGSSPKKVAADAAKAVGAVTGADILKAMVKDNSDAVKFAKELTGNVSAIPKDAIIAGAIALRAMAKSGKFANGSASESKKVVEGAVVSAVTKALNTLTIAIRKTIDEGLKTVKDAMNINDAVAPVTIESDTVTK
ncbi:variable large family protein (plasmid) [Borrelia coriaceae]|uniref:variable large family protein n=1 Tax=Borrelia coriaceae TaxID=144 RepID=UPI0004AF6CC4|nr:variable large family protein [Borrelia coriaceae]UPA17331.1 variable large family protein [Borrelia coriaceae]